MTNPHAGRGRGGRHHSRRRRGGRGRGGEGCGGQEGRGRGKSTPSNNKGGDAAVVKPLAKVVVEKIHKENKSPQDPKPPTPSVSFAKEVDNLKQVLGVGVKTMSSASLSGNTNNAGAGAPSGTAAAGDTPSEKEKMQQKLKEAREKAAASKEKKKSNKSKKHEQWLKEQQQQREDRVKSWAEKVKREEEKCNLISDLIGTEFNRVNKGVAINEETQKVITDKSREAHDALYGSNIKCRVEVVGLDRKDLNGRKGSIHHWDEDKGQFCVRLDTKKSRDCDVHFFKPVNLDVVTSSAQSAKKDRQLAANFIVSITSVTTREGGGNIGWQFSLEKSDVVKLESAHSRSNGLQEFLEERDALAHRLMKEQEEQRKEEERLEKEEEEDRKRRAELRAKKREEKERKKEEQRQMKEKAFKRRQEQAQLELEKKQAEAAEKANKMINQLEMTIRKAILPQTLGRMYQSLFHGWAEDGGSLEDFEEFKNDAKEMISDTFDEDDFEPEDIDDIFEEIFHLTDEKFKEILRKDRLEDDKKHAEILGVSHDADKRTLQKTYRKLALQFHPDKWSATSDHGMSKEEAEEHFKSIRNSYDHLMANFDE